MNKTELTCPHNQFASDQMRQMADITVAALMQTEEGQIFGEDVVRRMFWTQVLTQAAPAGNA